MHLNDQNPNLVTAPDPSSDHTSEEQALGFAMPAIQYSDRHFDGIIEYDLNYTESALLLDFLGNMEAETGIIHKRTVSEFAERHGVYPSNFYGKDGYIERLNATKMVKLKIKDHQLCGRVTEVPSKRMKNKKYRSKYPLKKSVLCSDVLTLLLPLSRRKTVLRMVLCMALHVDKQTGELNTLQTTEAWGKLIGGIKRINCDRAVDFLIEVGILDATRRFVVQGRIPSVSMGNAFLLLFEEKRKQQQRIETETKKTYGYDYRGIITDLQKFFGLDAKGWMKQHLSEARRKLLFWIEQDGLQAIKDFKEKKSPPNWSSLEEDWLEQTRKYGGVSST